MSLTMPLLQLRKNQDTVFQPLDELEKSLAATIPDLEWCWADDLASALDRIIAALAKKLRRRDFSDLEPTGPMRASLHRKASKLRRETRVLLQDARSLRRHAHRIAHARKSHPHIAYVVIIGRGEQLLAALRQHKDRENRLLLDDLWTDIGGGD